MKQAPPRSVLILCQTNVIADAFSTAMAALDPRLGVINYRNSAEYLADRRAPRDVEIALILTAGDTIMIAATAAALRREGINRALAVHIGAGPTPVGSSFACLPSDTSFDAVLQALQNMLGLPHPDTAIDALSPMRQRILCYMAEHLTDKEIAHRTGLKLTSVSDNVSKILHALGVRNRAAAGSIFRLHGRKPGQTIN